MATMFMQKNKFISLRPLRAVGARPLHVRVDRLANGHVIFHPLRRVSGSIRIANNGRCSRNGGRGQWARFEVIETDSEGFSLLSIGNKAKGWCLATEPDTGKLCVGDASFLWTCAAIPPAAAKSIASKVASDPFAAGQRVRLEHAVAPPKYVDTGELAFTVDRVHGKVVLRSRVPQYKRRSLRVTNAGKVEIAGGNGKFARFSVTPVKSADGTTTYHALKCMAHTSKLSDAGTEGWYLGLSTDGLLSGSVALGARAHWRVVIDADDSASGAFPSAPKPSLLFFEDVDLSQQQRAQFKREGYLHVPSVVPQELIRAALRRINHQLGKEGGWAPDEEGKLRITGDIQSSKEITDLLLKSPAFTLAQRLVGKGKVKVPGRGQVALRFPQLGRVPPHLPNHWHVDGMGKGKHSSFTLLLGVTLSDATLPFSGNFTVYPGSHSVLCPLIKSMVASATVGVWPHEEKPDVGDPVPVLAKAGDIVMATHKLAHRGGRNLSPNIRYQVYFRLKHVDHDDIGVAVLDDMWVEFEGLQTQ